jgi:hypothetical protein
MINRVRLFSDTNRQLFTQSLDERNAKFREVGDDVYVEEWPPWVADLAASLNGLIVEQDETYRTTSGLKDAGFQDTGAFSMRTNPPAVARETGPADNGPQIDSRHMQSWPNRKKTRSQP